MSDDIHEVFAVCYAGHARRRSENYIFGDPHDELTSISYYVWVIKGAHGTWVVDTGFDEIAEKERNRTLLNPVGKSLKALGVEPDKVENVILTHMHWDHAGNYDLFPNARYHVQDTEIAYATGRCMCHQTLRIPFSERDVHAIVGKIYAYRVDFHDGAEELAPGITVHKIGGHSKGLQCVRVEDAARLRGARLRLLPSLFAHRRGPRVPDHLFGRRHAGGLQDAAQARQFAPPHGAGPRPRGPEALSGRKARFGELDLPGGRGAEGVIPLPTCSAVIAGLDPAIHETSRQIPNLRKATIRAGCPWMPGSGPGMTAGGLEIYTSPNSANVSL